jgi:hypothetical protein
MSHGSLLLSLVVLGAGQLHGHSWAGRWRDPPSTLSGRQLRSIDDLPAAGVALARAKEASVDELVGVAVHEGTADADTAGDFLEAHWPVENFREATESL